MARPTKFDDDLILDCALSEGMAHGFEKVSVAKVAKRAGAPSGSVYHRFPSRDALMAQLWLRSVRRFQRGVLVIMKNDDVLVETAIAMAMHVVEFSDAHRSEAQLLLRYRQQDLMSKRMPETVQQQAATINDDVTRSFISLARKHAVDVRRLRFACVSVPLAVVREFLQSDHPPSQYSLDLLAETVELIVTSPSVKRIRI